MYEGQGTTVVCAVCSAAIIEKHHLKPLPSLGNVVCTKKCYDVVSKFLFAQDGARMSWETDSPDGTFEKSSTAWLLEWVRTPGNYSSYRGNKFGRSKSQIQKEIAEKINAAGAAMGLDRQRDERQVDNKIRYIERKFKEVYEWVNNTGQGVLADQGAESFEEIVKKKCNWYYDLLPIMRDRAATHPVFHSDEFSTGSDKDNDSGEDAEDDDKQDNNSNKSNDSPEKSNDDGNAVGGTYNSPVAIVRVPNSRSDGVSTIDGDVGSSAGKTTRGKRRNINHAFDELVGQLLSDKTCRMSKKSKLEDANSSQDLVDKACVLHERLVAKQLHDDDIAATFPQCIRFLQLSSLTAAKREKYISKYNEYAKRVGLDDTQFLDPSNYD